MTRAEIIAYNAGLATAIALATASAAALRLRLSERPTRFNYAVGALEGFVEAATDLVLKPLVDATNQATSEVGRQ